MLGSESTASVTPLGLTANANSSSVAARMLARKNNAAALVASEKEPSAETNKLAVSKGKENTAANSSRNQKSQVSNKSIESAKNN